jgi:EAL domain-containing protein (putative c-di-GMP-specific phosphodiesterase class I)
MVDPALALDILNALHAMGIRIAIDDFGTGYSSLGYLKRLPASSLKIDRSFVVDMMTSRDLDVIVRSTIDLAHNLGLTVVAEGVETQEVHDRLVTQGCDDVQGFYVSRPLPATELAGWLDQYPAPKS